MRDPRSNDGRDFNSGELKHNWMSPLVDGDQMPDQTEGKPTYSVEADEVYIEMDFGVVLRRAAIKSITFPKSMFQEAYEAGDDFIKIRFPQGLLYTDPPPAPEKEADGEEKREGLN